MNDFASSISGYVNAIVGGALELQVNNAGAAGVKENAIAVSIITGGVDINTKLGDMKLSTLAGDVEMSTTAGAANLKTAAGNVEVSTAAGNVNVKTSAGNLTVTTSAGAATLGSEGGATTVKGPAGVTLGNGGHPLAYGDVFATILQAIIQAMTDATGAGYTCAAPAAPIVPGPLVLALTPMLAQLAPGLGISALNTTS